MQRFVHHKNIARYRKLVAEAESDPSRDEDLLAEEEAKDARPPRGSIVPEAYQLERTERATSA
jgi:hypothetical protein